MLPVICKVNNEMAQGLKEYYGVLLCPLTHYVLFMVSVVLPTELFVELCCVIYLSCQCNTKKLCCVIYLSCQCNTNIINQNMTWSLTFLETCIY